MRRKGPLFPSFTEPPFRTLTPSVKVQPNRALPLGESWRRHEGRSARIRRLRHLCRPITSSKDPQVVEMLAKIKDLVKNEAEPEYALLHLSWMGVEKEKDTGLDWVVVMDIVLESIEKKEQEINDINSK